MRWNRKELNNVMEGNQDKSWPLRYTLLCPLWAINLFCIRIIPLLLAAAAAAPVPLPSMIKQLLGHYKFSQVGYIPSHCDPRMQILLFISVIMQLNFTDLVLCLDLCIHNPKFSPIHG